MRTVPAEASASVQAGQVLNQWCNVQVELQYNMSFAQSNLFKDHLLHNSKQLSEMMKTWILLDNQSTTDIFCDKSLVTNIRTVEDTLRLHTNGGTCQVMEQYGLTAGQ